MLTEHLADGGVLHVHTLLGQELAAERGGSAGGALAKTYQAADEELLDSGRALASLATTVAVLVDSLTRGPIDILVHALQ